MATLIGAVIGFVAMLAVRGRAGVAAGLAVLGIVLGIGFSFVVGVEFAFDVFQSPEGVADQPDWQLTRIGAGIMAALPGTLGALLARRD